MGARRTRADVWVAAAALACCAAYYVAYLAGLGQWAVDNFVAWPLAAANLLAGPVGLGALGYLVGALAGRWVRARSDRARAGFRAFGAAVALAYVLCCATLFVLPAALYPAGAYAAVSSLTTEVLAPLMPVAGAVAGLASAPAAA